MSHFINRFNHIAGVIEKRGGTVSHNDSVQIMGALADALANDEQNVPVEEDVIPEFKTSMKTITDDGIAEQATKDVAHDQWEFIGDVVVESGSIGIGDCDGAGILETEAPFGDGIFNVFRQDVSDNQFVLAFQRVWGE